MSVTEPATLGEFPSPEQIEGLEESLSYIASEIDSYQTGLDRRARKAQYDKPMTEEEAGRLLLFFIGLAGEAELLAEAAKLAADRVEIIYREEHSKVTDAYRDRIVEWYERRAASRRGDNA